MATRPKNGKPKATTNRPGKKYDWGDKKGAVHTRPKKGMPKAKDPKPKGGGFAQQLKRRTTQESKNRLIQKTAGRRTSLESRNQFLKKYKLRDPDLDDPGYFTRPQTLGQAQIEADRATSLRYGGEEQELRNEAELVNRQGRQIPAWFDQYRQQISGAQQASAAMAQPVIQQAQQVAQASGQSSTPPGTIVNPDVAQRDAQAAASRQALGQSFATLLSGQQQANNQYFAGRNVVAGAAQLGLQGENNMRARQAQQAKTRLAGEKGDYRATQLAQMRDKERQYGLERSAFGLKAESEKNDVAIANQKAASDRAKDRRKRQADRRKYREDKRKFGVTRADKLAKERRDREQKEKDRAAKGGSSGSGGGGFTPLQRREARSDLRKAINLAASRPGQERKAYEALIREKDMDPVIARAAVNIVKYGHAGSTTSQRLKEDYGITAPRRPRPKPNTSRPKNARGNRGQSRPT